MGTGHLPQSGAGWANAPGEVLLSVMSWRLRVFGSRCTVGLARSGAGLPGHGARLMALIVDLVCVGVVTACVFVIGEITESFDYWVLPGVFVVTLGVWTASGLCLSGGQTLGKALFGLHVRRAGGDLPSPDLSGLTWAFGRQTVGYVVIDLAGIGGFIALVAPNRKMPHDVVFGSEVVPSGMAGGSRRERLNAYWDRYQDGYTRLERRWRWAFGVWKQLTRIVVIVASVLTIRSSRAEGSARVWASRARRVPAVASRGLVIAVLVQLLPPPRMDPAGADVVVVAFVDDTPNAELFMMSAFGVRPPHRLTRDDHVDGAGSLSGDKIVFASYRGSSSDIYVMDVDGSDERRLTNGPGEDFEPVWSFDGERIAFTRQFVSGSLARPFTYIMNADGSNPRRVAAGIHPSWSPDGRRIAFVDGNGLYIANADGTGLRRVIDANEEYTRYVSPAWSPDGTQIAFSRMYLVPGTTELDQDIYVMGVDSGNTQRLTTSVDVETSPYWVLNGSKIVYYRQPDVSDLGGRRRGTVQGFDPEDSLGAYYIMNSDGTDQMLLYSRASFA